MTLFLVSSGTFLLGFMQFLIYGFNQDMITNSISLDSGFVEVAAYGWNEKKTLIRALEVSPKMEEEIKSAEGVRALSYRIRSGALLSFNNRTRFISVLSADPSSESKISTLHKYMIKGRMPADPNGIHEAVIGHRLARALKMNTGDTFYLVTSQFDGSTGAMPFQLSGIFDSKNSSLDSGRVFISLESGEELFGTNLAGRKFYTSIALGMDDYLAAQKIKERLTEKFPVPLSEEGLKPEESDKFDPVALDWRELNPGIIELLKIASLKMDIFFAFFVISISFGVLNSVQMSIQERLRQFGIQLAIGTKTKDLFFLIFWEIFFLLVPAVVLGTFLAGLTGLYFNYNPIVLTGAMGEIYESMGYIPRWRPIVSINDTIVILTGMVIPAFLVSLLSARRIFKLDPIKVINII